MFGTAAQCCSRWLADGDIRLLFDNGPVLWMQPIGRCIYVLWCARHPIDLRQMNVEQSGCFFCDQIDYDNTELHAITSFDAAFALANNVKAGDVGL